LARYGVTTPVRLVYEATLLEPGKEARNTMLRRTRNTIHHPGEFKPKLWNKVLQGNRDEVMKRYTRSTGRFARFFLDLGDCFDMARNQAKSTASCTPHLADMDALQDMKLTLVGHGMGAIIVNELIANYNHLPYQNIVFMVATTSLRHSRNALVPLLQASADGQKSSDLKVRFFNLLLHPKADAREDSVYGLLPSGSLLEWINEVLAKPKTVLDRTMGKWRNLRPALHIFPAEVQTHMTFRIFGFDQRRWREHLGGDGVPCADYAGPNPVTHGSFNDTAKEYWRPTFWGALSGYHKPRTTC
jgi:hypothetical protein